MSATRGAATRTKHPSYGVAAGKKRAFCVQHAPEGMTSARAYERGSKKSRPEPQRGRRDAEADDEIHQHGETTTNERQKRRPPSTRAGTPSNGSTAGTSKRMRQARSGSGRTQETLVAVAPDLLKTASLETMPRPISAEGFPLTLRATPPFRASPGSAAEGMVKAELGV